MDDQNKNPEVQQIPQSSEPIVIPAAKNQEIQAKPTPNIISTVTNQQAYISPETNSSQQQHPKLKKRKLFIASALIILVLAILAGTYFGYKNHIKPKTKTVSNSYSSTISNKPWITNKFGTLSISYPSNWKTGSGPYGTGSSLTSPKYNPASEILPAPSGQKRLISENLYIDIFSSSSARCNYQLPQCSSQNRGCNGYLEDTLNPQSGDNEPSCVVSDIIPLSIKGSPNARLIVSSYDSAIWMFVSDDPTVKVGEIDNGSLPQNKETSFNVGASINNQLFFIDVQEQYTQAQDLSKSQYNSEVYALNHCNHSGDDSDTCFNLPSPYPINYNYAPISDLNGFKQTPIFTELTKILDSISVD